MPLPVLTVPDAGSPLRVSVRFDHRNVGAYELYLWNAAATARVKLIEGISEDEIEDAVELAPPLAEYDGRILDCFVTMINPGDDGDAFTASLVGAQNGVDLEQSVSASGTIGSSPVAVRLALRIAIGG
jgi:hypothetical protein